MDNYRMIDVKDVKGFLYDFILFIKYVIIYILKSAKRYFVLTFLVFAMSLMVEGYYWYMQKPYYKSTIAFYVTSLDVETYGDMVHGLNDLINGRSYSAVSRALNMSEEEAKQIIKIEAKNREGGVLKNDRTKNVPIYINVTVTNKEVFKPLQVGLLKFLNSSPFIMRRNDEDKKQIAQKIIYIQKDLSNIDSVIISYNASLLRQRIGKDSSSGFANIAALFSYKDQLEDKIIGEDRKRDIQPGVEVYSDFLSADKPAGHDMRLLYIIIAGSVLLSFGFSTLINLLRNAT